MKEINKLSPNTLNTLGPGLHNDGNNLYLQASKNKLTGHVSRSWIYRYRYGGKLRDMGLGSLTKISLSAARKLATDVSIKLQTGEDPIEARRFARAATRDSDTRTRMTLEHTVSIYLKIKKSTWSKQQQAKWQASFRENVYPKHGKTHITEIDDGVVRRILEPIWDNKTPTAKSLRRKLETVLAWAAYMKYRPPGANPAAWDNALELHFGDGKDTGNRPSMSYEKVPAFMNELEVNSSIAARALQFLILTAARSDDVLKATWAQVNLPEKVWIIPARKTDKMPRDLPIPLTDQTLKILEAMKGLQVNDFVFPGTKDNQPLAHGAMRDLLADRPETPHGFRASFRSWADDCTDYDHDIKEMAIGHKIKGATEAAYRRTTMYLKRVSLMKEWADFLSK